MRRFIFALVLVLQGCCNEGALPPEQQSASQGTDSGVAMPDGGSTCCPTVILYLEPTSEDEPGPDAGAPDV